MLSFQADDVSFALFKKKDKGAFFFKKARHAWV